MCSPRRNLVDPAGVLGRLPEGPGRGMEGRERDGAAEQRGGRLIPLQGQRLLSARSAVTAKILLGTLEKATASICTILRPREASAFSASHVQQQWRVAHSAFESRRRARSILLLKSQTPKVAHSKAVLRGLIIASGSHYSKLQMERASFGSLAWRVIRSWHEIWYDLEA